VRVANVPWPAGCVAVSIDRHSQLVAPAPDTELRPGDLVLVVAPAGAETEIRKLLGDTRASQRSDGQAGDGEQ